MWAAYGGDEVARHLLLPQQAPSRCAGPRLLRSL